MAELNITPEEQNETQNHIDEMVAKADGKEAPKTPEGAPEDKPERPAWLPEKFDTPEAMAEAYAAMEKKQSAGKPSEDDAEAEGKLDDEAQAAADAAVAEAGLDMDALGQKIVSNGDLDDSDYEALQKQGISKEMVQSYVAGQQALGDRLVSNMHQTVGGEDSFNELIEWASDNLDKAEIEAFNTTVDTGSEASVKMALQGLQSRFQSTNGVKPNLLGGNRKGDGSNDVFRSTAEVTNAMRDPRYARDAAYRADVTAKLGRSNVM